MVHERFTKGLSLLRAAQLHQPGRDARLATSKDVGQPLIEQVGAEDAPVGALQPPARALQGLGVVGGLGGSHLAPADGIDPDDALARVWSTTTVT